MFEHNHSIKEQIRHSNVCTVTALHTGAPKQISVSILRFDKADISTFLAELQTAPTMMRRPLWGQSHQRLHCLFQHDCRNSLGHYDLSSISEIVKQDWYIWIVSDRREAC